MTWLSFWRSLFLLYWLCKCTLIYKHIAHCSFSSLYSCWSVIFITFKWDAGTLTHTVRILYPYIMYLQNHREKWRKSETETETDWETDTVDIDRQIVKLIQSVWLSITVLLNCYHSISWFFKLSAGELMSTTGRQ